MQKTIALLFRIDRIDRKRKLYLFQRLEIRKMFCYHVMNCVMGIGKILK